MLNRTMIQRLLIGGLIACFTVVNASAKETAKKQKAKEPQGQQLAFDGPYIGVSGSLGIFEAYRGDNDGYMTDNSSWTSTLINPGTGIQLGYDWRKGTQVLGVIGDMHWLDANVLFRDNLGSSFPDATPNEIHSSLSWMFTLRGRVGITSEDTLLYLTGGMAAADIGVSLRDAETHDLSWIRYGVAAGAGAEFTLSSDLNLGAEFLYTKFAPDTIQIRETTELYHFAISDSTTQVKVSLNYQL